MYEELKKRRLELGKTLEQIAEETKIKKSYLQLIEKGKFDELPIELYTRAYIKTYAQSLGLDASLILKDYDEYLKSKKQTVIKIEPTIAKESLEKKSTFLKKLPNWSITAGIIFTVIFITILLIQFEKKEPTLPPPPVTQQTMSEIPKVEEKIEKTEPKQELSVNKQKLEIEATDKVWMRITIDDKEKKEFLLNPGQKIELHANKSFKLHIGNAGGVKILFNDKELGKLGETGQVVYLNLPQEKD
ncbi:helix-turn-helix domain-containing protein [Thermodesulfovibrio sp.]|jgi:cytoskeletal protein RodZ|uniref:helix-turn-helix domain-containing protein n=1 Tax=Thermodesulfovibrio sp. TaxID=2067987 RepID=UPI003D0DD696